MFVCSREPCPVEKDIVSISMQRSGRDRVRMDLKSLSPEAAQILFGETIIMTRGRKGRRKNLEAFHTRCDSFHYRAEVGGFLVWG